MLADGTNRVHSAAVNAAAAAAEVEKVRAEVARHEGRNGKARTATRVRGRAPCSCIANRIFPGRPR